MDPVLIASIVQGGLTLIRILDEVEAKGGTLTPEQRQQRETERARLTSLWANLKPQQ